MILHAINVSTEFAWHCGRIPERCIAVCSFLFIRFSVILSITNLPRGRRQRVWEYSALLSIWIVYVGLRPVCSGNGRDQPCYRTGLAEAASSEKSQSLGQKMLCDLSDRQTGSQKRTATASTAWVV